MASFGVGTKRSFSAMEGEVATVSVAPLPEKALQYASQTTTRSSSAMSIPSSHFNSPVRNCEAGLRSHSASPVPFLSQHPQPAPRSFALDASIVLIGIRGTGKSTLGIIGSTVLQRRLIDVDWTFQELTGHSSAVYKRIHGAKEHNRRRIEVLETILYENATGCLIVVGSCSMEKAGQALLREYCKSHPVIHVLRDGYNLQSYLKILEQEKIEHLLRLSGAIFRGCSNLEFYNISEASVNSTLSGPETISSATNSPNSRANTPFLTLKKAERHFLKFITLVTAGASPAFESASPLSQIKADARSYTYAVSVPLSELLSSKVDIEDLDVGSDAFEIFIDHTVKGDLTFHGLGQPGSVLDSDQADKISRGLALVRRTTIIPLIYHVDLASLKLDHSVIDPKHAYLDLIYHGIRLAPEFATVDLSLTDAEITDILNYKGSTRMIGHLSATNDNAPAWQEGYWLAAYERAKRLGCDMVRLSRPARTHEANIMVENFRLKIATLPEPRIPVIAYNTGQLGRPSACFNPIFTPVTHKAIPRNPRPHIAPLISSREATQALYASFIFDPMRFYIVGGSSGYSLSPAMHNAAYQAVGMPHSYKTHQTPTLNDLHGLVEDPNFGGASLSIPFKIEVIALTHSLSRHARAIGAVNTLIPVRHLRADGSIPDDISLLNERNRAGPVRALYGENTDWIGIRACIRRGLSPVNAVRPRTSGLVIGAGGMARAAIYAMIHLGVKNIVIFNRTVGHAEKVVAHFNRLLASTNTPYGNSTTLPPSASGTTFHVLRTREDPWPEKLRQPTMIIGCIPTHPMPNSAAPNFTLPDQWLKSPTGGMVLEVGYKSLITPLLVQIRQLASKGWVSMDGLDLLPEQGFAQFELFTGRRAPRRLMRQEVLRNWRDEEGRADPKFIDWRLEKIEDQEP